MCWGTVQLGLWKGALNIWAAVSLSTCFSPFVGYGWKNCKEAGSCAGADETLGSFSSYSCSFLSAGWRYNFGLAAVYLCCGHRNLTWLLEVAVLGCLSILDSAGFEKHFYEVYAVPVSTVVAANTKQVRRRESAALRAWINFLKEILRRQVLFRCFLSLKQLALINLGDRMYKSNSSS